VILSDRLPLEFAKVVPLEHCGRSRCENAIRALAVTFMPSP
jgi:hypothetical protein